MESGTVDETVTEDRMVENSASVAKWTLVSRVTGFARVLLIGAVLGPSYFGNLFQIANQLPWILFELTVGVLLGAILIPRLMPHIDSGDHQSVERVANGALGVVIVAFGFVAGLVMLTAPFVGSLFGAGVPDGAERADFVRAALPLILLTAPQLVGYGIAAVGQAVQQALGQFALPAAASILENISVIVALGIYASWLGTGTDLADVGLRHLLLLGGGSSLGVFLHAVIQWWGVRRLGVRLRPTAGWRDPEVRAMVSTALPSSGTALLNGARFLVLMLAANTVAGGVVALQLALNVFSLPVALGAKPVAYAILPRLSTLWKRSDQSGFSDEYARGLSLAALVAIPSAAACAALGWFGAPIVAVGEMGTDRGRELIALAIAGVAGAIIGETMHQIAISASYARHDARGPLQAYALRLVILVVGAGLAVAFTTGPWIVFFTTLALTASDVISGIYHHIRVVNPLPVGAYRLTRSVIYTAGAAALAFGIAGGAAAVVAPLSDARLPRLGAGALLGLLALAVYAALRSKPDDELKTFIAGFRSKEVAGV